MGLAAGLNSATLGLTFAYDLADGVNSYIGEPTTNLIPSPGVNAYPTLTNGWGTYNTNRYCDPNPPYTCGVFWAIPSIASVSNNIVTTVSAHPIRSFDVLRPQTTGGGLTANTDYLMKKISDTQFSIHAYNSSQDGSQGYVSTTTGGFKVHDSYWLDQRVSINASSFPTMWWGAPHLPNSALVKEIITNGFKLGSRAKSDCIRLHWFRTDASDGMAYGVDASVTIGSPVTVSFYARAASQSAVGQSIAFSNYNYSGPPGYSYFSMTATWGAVGQWVKNSYTFTPTHNALISYWFPNTAGMDVDIANIQIEQKDHATQFVAGTRSVTQGLLPLTGSTIDLTNVSFNSNAQMVFDGTNDYINTNFTSGYEGTVELIIKCSNYDGDIPFSLDSDNFSSGPNIYFTNNGIAWNTGDSGNNTFSNSSYPNSNYHHLVITNQSSGAALYIDGVLIGTAAGKSMVTTGSNKLWLGRFHGDGYYFNGELPVVKLYSRPLNASEIKDNYKGYKTRFNLA